MLDSLLICKSLSCSCVISISDVSCEPSVVKKKYSSQIILGLCPRVYSLCGGARVVNVVAEEEKWEGRGRSEKGMERDYNVNGDVNI